MSARKAELDKISAKEKKAEEKVDGEVASTDKKSDVVAEKK